MITVLHVDDDRFDIEIVQFKLERVDKDIHIVGEINAEAALNRIQSEDFDAVLCDFQMPSMNGLDVLRELRESGRRIPFIFLTGQGNERLAVQALQAGADDYFTKEEGLAHYERLVHSLRSRVLARRKAREQERMERALNAIFAEANPKTDREFLDALLLKLVEVIGVEYALVSVVDDDNEDMVRTISCVAGGQIVENIAYNLADTPCDNVVAKEPCVYSEDVQKLFPEDEMLVTMKADGYAGVPLFHRGGGPLGHVAILDTKPIIETSLMVSLLRALSVRVTAELERMHILKVLEESEQQLRDVIESMISGFALHEIICDENGKPVDYRFLNINAAFERLTGLKARETIGKRVLELIPDLEQFWIETYGHVALTGEPTHFSNYNKSLNRHFEIRAYSPSSGLFAVIFNDVTNRVEAAQALRESERRFRTLVELNVAGIFRSTIDGRLLECNDALLRLLGFASFSEIEKINMEELYFRASDRADLVNDLKSQGALKNRVVKLKTAAKKTILCLTNLQLLDGDHILGTVVEINEPDLIQT